MPFLKVFDHHEALSNKELGQAQEYTLASRVICYLFPLMIIFRLHMMVKPTHNTQEAPTMTQSLLYLVHSLLSCFHYFCLLYLPPSLDLDKTFFLFSFYVFFLSTSPIFLSIQHIFLSCTLYLCCLQKIVSKCPLYRFYCNAMNI